MARSATKTTSILPFRLAALLAAQLFDFGTFTIMVGRHGIMAELNPVVSQGFVLFGMPFLALSKIVLVVLIGSIVALLAGNGSARRVSPALAAVVTMLAVFAGLAGGISNVVAG